MKRFARYGLKIVAWLAGIVTLIWIVLLVYVNVNQKHLIEKISSIIHKQTRGDVQIGDLSVSLIRTFPVLSLQLSDVNLKDSLYPIHKKELLKAEDIYVSVNLKGLFSGDAIIGRILVRNGSINIITDTTGYSNEYVLQRSEQKADTSAEKHSFPQIVFKNVYFLYRNPLRNKWHEANIKSLRCNVKEHGNELFNIYTRIDMVVDRLTFNTDKGSYLKGKKLSGDFILQADKLNGDILLNNIQLNIDNHPFHFNGKFHLDKVSPVFNLAISSYNIDYTKAVSVLNDTLAAKLNSIDFDKPVDVIVELKGKTLFKYVPAVKVVMDIDLTSVNSFGSSVFNIEKGKAGVNVTINGPEGRGDTLLERIDGNIDIKNAVVRYTPRNIALKNLNGTIKFQDNDLLVEKFTGETGSTKLEMNGAAKNFVAVLNKEPEKVDIRWKISSPLIKLEDLTGFLSEPSEKGNKKAGQGSVAGRVDKMFSDGDIYVALQTPVMEYKTFRATAVNADVVMRKTELSLEKVFFKHAGGTMQITGSMKNGKDFNPVSLHTKMSNMDVAQLFAAFNNFGQDAITKENLKGKLSAEINYSTSITNKAKIVPSASEGKINFVLQNGELINFSPLQEAGKKAFKKQDFSRISFADLKNTLDVKGTAFIVNPMDIRSTALNFSVEGVYDFKKGTDMSISFPIKNLTRSQANTDLSDDAKQKKGVSLRLRARTGDDGKLKISWDPFRRAVKNKEELKDSTSAKK